MTVTEPTLFDSEDTHDVRWQRYIERHPEVWRDILEIVAKAHDRGDKRISTKWIFETIRARAPRDDGSPVALNNNWSRPASRMIAAQHPEYASMLHTRERTVRA